MAARHAFVLNLDAELELEAGHGYAPTRAVIAATNRYAAQVAKTLVPKGAVVVDDATTRPLCQGRIGLAWCPTPNALARLRAVGAQVGETPSETILRRVARRDFAYVPELPGACVHEDLDAAIAHLRARDTLGRPFRLKRVHGMAGRGHRVVRGVLTASDEAFIRGSGPAIIVEPEVTIVRELALHGFLDRGGRLERGDLCTSSQTKGGAWVETTRLAPEAAGDTTHRALVHALERAASALHEAGYFGPFGVDAFAYDDGARTALRTQSEINARYTMGWAIGFAARGERRPDLIG